MKLAEGEGAREWLWREVKSLGDSDNETNFTEF